MLLPLLAPLLLAAATPAAPAPRDAADYRAEVEAWRRDREARLRAPDGWLALIALHWLHPGENRFGGAPGDEIRLPGALPAHAGTLLVEGETVWASVAAGVPARLNGRPLAGRGAVALRSDAGDAAPDLLGIGSVTLQIIRRGGRLAARVKDTESATLRHFSGLAWYPIAPGYRVIASLAPRAAPTRMMIPDASGGRQEMESPGTLTFALGGRATRLEPVRDGPDDGDLLVVFRDATSGRETYGGGRFLRARRRPDGAYVLDFNQAYSPPCAFTPYATCPLPPPGNRLPFPVPAGEKAPPAADHGAR